MRVEPMACRLILPGLLAVAAVATVPLGGRAQTVTLDEAAFRLLSQGREVGRESFTVRQSGTGSGTVIIAQGRIVVDTARAAREVTTTLQVGGPELRPVAYELRATGASPQTIAGRLAGNRFSTRTATPAGETLREFIAGDRAVVVDEGVAHHFYFLARRIEAAGDLPIIIPSQSRQVTAIVSAAGPETVEIEGQRFQAARLVVQWPNADPRHVWVDAQGRVLRMTIPARGWVAERTTPPR